MQFYPDCFICFPMGKQAKKHKSNQNVDLEESDKDWKDTSRKSRLQSCNSIFLKSATKINN